MALVNEIKNKCSCRAAAAWSRVTRVGCQRSDSTPASVVTERTDMVGMFGLKETSYVQNWSGCPAKSLGKRSPVRTGILWASVKITSKRFMREERSSCWPWPSPIFILAKIKNLSSYSCRCDIGGCLAGALSTSAPFVRYFRYWRASSIQPPVITFRTYTLMYT